MSLEDIKRIYDEKDAKIVAEKKHVEQLHSQQVVSDTIIESISSLIKYMEGRVSKTEIMNQLTEIGTPDAIKVVNAIQKLEETIVDNKTDIKPILDTLELLVEYNKKYSEDLVSGLEKLSPKGEVKVNNLNEITLDTSDLEQVIKDELKKINIAPKVEVKTEKTDIEPLRGLLQSILDQVVANKPEKPLDTLKISNLKEIKPTDTKTIENKLEIGNKYLKEISEKKFGGSGGSGRATPYEENGIPAFVELSNGYIPTRSGLMIPIHDEQIIDDTNAPTTTIITYKLNNVTMGTQTISVSGAITNRKMS